VYNPEGKPETLRFDSINSMLLNEFLKEHRQVQAQERKLREQQAMIAELKQQIQTLVARVERTIGKSNTSTSRRRSAKRERISRLRKSGKPSVGDP
jgi:predicted RNase H-like nuclease (RuvC/YqgF family)